MWIDSLHPAELEQIVRLQKSGDFGGVMKWITDLGPSAPLVIFSGLIYLCFDSRLGARLLLVYFASDLFAYFGKLAFHLPRPFWMDARIIAYEPQATSYGFPSGHAIVATCVWFLLAGTIRRWWAWAGAAAIVFLVCLSRVYLGAHFISDVIGGCLFGAIILLLYLAIERRALPWLAAKNLARQILTCLAVVLLLAGIGIAIFSIAVQVDDPTRSANYPGPRRSLKSLGLYTGALLGLGVGLSTAARWARFDAGGPIRMRVLRIVLLAGPGTLYWLRPKELLKDLPDPFLFILYFAGCALAAWACIFWVPWLFLKFGLAEKREA